MQDKLVIVGYSGHAYVVADAAIDLGLNLEHYCEKTPKKENPFDLNYLGFEGEDDFQGWNGNYAFILGVGENKLRHRIGLEIIKRNKDLLTLVHPSASVSSKVGIGRGNFIGRQVSINSFAKIGDFCIINTASIIEHECVIENGAHIAPGAVLAGNVEVGENSFIGANAVVKQGVKIGANVVVGAGSVVIKEIPDDEIVVGNPGKVIKKK